MKREKYFVKMTEYKSGTIEYRVVYQMPISVVWIQVEGSKVYYVKEDAIAFAEHMEGTLIEREEFL